MKKKNTLSFRSEISAQTKRVVIKLGSQAITYDHGGVDLEKLTKIVRDVATLHQHGLEVVLVSSGAIHSGRAHLPPQKNPSIDYLQACSALGQPILMRIYSELFQQYQIQCAQVLLTHDDLKDRTRYLNIRQTLNKLLQHHIIPILNENDSVSFAEISVGDNDQLAALITEVLEADVLCLLTGPDGLYNQDPHNPDPLSPTVIHYDQVPFDKNFEEVKLLSKSQAGRGGMRTKLMAVRKLTPLGIGVIMSTYKDPSPILRALTESSGSYFFPAPQKLLSGRKSWLLALVKNYCFLEIDEGAFKAIERGASLLPSGIKSLHGSFKRGDCVGLQYQDLPFAVGLSEYDSDHVQKIMGRQGHEIHQILGYFITAVVIHRDNLALRKILCK